MTAASPRSFHVEIHPHHEPLPADAEPMGPPLRLRLRLALPVEQGRLALRLLGTPSRLPELHPLIDRVTEEPPRQEGSRSVLDFTIDEHVPVLGGLLRLPNRYRGRVVLDAAMPEQVRTSGWSKPGIRVEVRHRLLGEGLLEETLWCSGPALLRPFLDATVRAAHEAQLLAAARATVTT